MNADRIRQIRQALTDELGEGYSFWFPNGEKVQINQLRHGITYTIVDIRMSDLAAIGRALQSAAGETIEGVWESNDEGMIPLDEAIRAIRNEPSVSSELGVNIIYRSDAIAALQALGGGG